MPETEYDVAHFPHLHTLDIRHVDVQTPDRFFLHELNDRSADLLLPVGTRHFSPSLRTLHISSSGLGVINLGDFVSIGDFIPFLSLGVVADSSFLRPDTLDRFTSLETFEFWWTLYSDLPFDSLAGRNKITELRNRDRWERFPRGEWWNFEAQDYVELEWSEGRSLPGSEAGENDEGDEVESGELEAEEKGVLEREGPPANDAAPEDEHAHEHEQEDEHDGSESINEE